MCSGSQRSCFKIKIWKICNPSLILNYIKILYKNYFLSNFFLFNKKNLIVKGFSAVLVLFAFISSVFIPFLIFLKLFWSYILALFANIKAKCGQKKTEKGGGVCDDLGSIHHTLQLFANCYWRQDAKLEVVTLTEIWHPRNPEIRDIFKLVVQLLIRLTYPLKHP